MSIAEELSVALEGIHIFTDGFDCRSDRNGQDETHTTPDRAPEHQRDSDGKRIESDSAADDLRIEKVHRQDVHGGGKGGDKQHRFEFVRDGKSSQKRGKNR